MSQAALAGRLGKSEQWLSNIEREVRRADRYSILLPIADVLRVSVAELTGERPAAEVRPEVDHAAGRAVRLLLSAHRFTDASAERHGHGSADRPGHEARTDGVRHIWRLVHEARYSELGELLPELVAGCEAAAWRAGPDANGDAFRLLAVLYQAVAAMMAKLGDADATWVAADRSAFAAARAGDVLLVAAADFRLGHVFLKAGRLDQAERAVQVAADALEPRASASDVEALTLWGALHLVAAVASARKGDAGAAWAAMARAEDAAARLGPDRRDERFDTEFGAANVAMHAVSIAAELGDAAEALRRAGVVDTAGMSAERRARLLLDVARAEAQQRRTGAAVNVLEEAERLAPELVRCHWLSRETVRDLLRRERGLLRHDRLALAIRMGLA
jgi:transcriptional regulator with XRE-family HTH domain